MAGSVVRGTELKSPVWIGVSSRSESSEGLKRMRTLKRITHRFDVFVSQSNAEIAFRAGIEHKRAHPQVRELWKDGAVYVKGQCRNTLEFIDEEKKKAFLDSIINDLKNGTYQHSAPRKKHQFCTSKSKGKDGKWRDLYCPSLRDHIMQHMLMQASKEAFTRGMYRWCCGSVPGRGRSDVIRAITDWCKNDDAWRFFVVLDIKKNFDNTTADHIRAALRRKIKDERLLMAHDMVINSAPVACPVGYYMSPWYANLVLEPIDHYIVEGLYKVRRGKRKPLIRHYIRYQDDMLLMSSSKRDLEKAVQAIKEKLHADLGLEIKTSWEIKRIAEYDVDGDIVPGTYRIPYIGYLFDRTRTIQNGRNYLSTKRLSHRMRKKKEATGETGLHDCQTLVSKAGFASQTDNGRFLREVNENFSLTKAKGVISDAAKRGIFSEPGTV